MSVADEEAKASVLHANEAFYEAFRNCNYDAMDELWSRTREVTVVHPGWPGLMGREDVMESWYRILRIGTPPPIEASDAHVLLNGNAAMVTCTEDLGDVKMIATNTFVLEEGSWLLTSHQAQHLPEG